MIKAAAVLVGLLLVIQHVVADCSSRVTFDMDGQLDGAPILDLQTCSNCPATTCGPCQYGINGYLCRPNGTIWCGGCNNTCSCANCIFGGPNLTKLCVAVELQQYVGYLASLSNFVPDLFAAVNQITAYTLAQLDAVTAIADATGAQTFSFTTGSGSVIVPNPSAFNQTDYSAPALQTASIVWSASLLSETQQDLAAVLQASFSNGLSGNWTGLPNSALPPPGRLIPLTQPQPVVDLTKLPVLPLQEYFGTCKSGLTCAPASGVTVPVNIITIKPIGK